MSCEGCGCGPAPDPPVALVGDLPTVSIDVFRYQPGTDNAGHVDRFEVPYRIETSLVDALNWIKDHLDPTLVFRWSCRMGVCGSCGLMVNGRPRLGCETFVREFTGKRRNRPIRIAPLANFDVERDLVTDFEPFLEKLTAVKPWHVAESVATDDTVTQSPAQMLDFASFAQCINCLLCYAACPQVGLASDFLGPAAITAAIKRNRDSRDHGTRDRLPVLDTEAGIWGCTFVGACSTVCPKQVDPAAAIQLTKVEATWNWARGFVQPGGAA